MNGSCSRRAGHAACRLVTACKPTCYSRALIGAGAQRHAEFRQPPDPVADRGDSADRRPLFLTRRLVWHWVALILFALAASPTGSTAISRGGWTRSRARPLPRPDRRQAAGRRAILMCWSRSAISPAGSSCRRWSSCAARSWSPACANSWRSCGSACRSACWRNGRPTMQMIAARLPDRRRCRASELPVSHAIGEVLLWIAAVLTLITGYDYLPPASSTWRPQPTDRPLAAEPARSRRDNP